MTQKPIPGRLRLAERVRLESMKIPALAALWLLLAATAVAQDGAALLSVDQLKQLSLEQLLNVKVTTVSRYPESVLDAASAIQVITSQEIERSGAVTLPEALRLAPNLDVAQKNPHDWGISARGFNTALANKLLVMIDGRTVYTPLFSGVFWDVQDTLLADIDRIEVVSGPGATLWGANAVNGVINVITKNARDTQGLLIQTAAGNQLNDFAAVRYGTTVAPNVYLRVYGKTFDEGSAVLANGASASDSWTMHRGGFRLDADLPTDNTFTLQGDIYRGSEYVVTGGIQRVGGGNLLGRWTRSWSPTADMHLQVYYDRTHLVDPITNQFGSNEPVTDDLDTYDVDFQDRFAVGLRQELVWGLGYRYTHDLVQNSHATAFLPPEVVHQLFSWFAQDEISLHRHLRLTLGTKLEHNDYTGIEVEPSARLNWRVTPNQSLWTAVSRAVRMPSRYDRDIFLPNPPPLIASGNKNFQSETVVAYEAGYRAQLTTGLSASVSLFYNRYNRLRSLEEVSVAPPRFMFTNDMEGETHGLEVSGQYQVRRNWRIRAGYDLLVEHLHNKPGTADIYHGLNEAADPRNRATLESSWDLPHRISLDTDLRWVDTRPTAGGVVPAYAEMDLRLAWRPTNWMEWSIVGQNLLHAHHPEFGVAIPRREEIPRSVYTKVSLRF